MGRAPCCDKANVKKGPWSPEEDAKLKEYIEKFGTGGNWISLPQKAGLKRCGKSCRLRWLNYLRPNIKHGEFSDEEDRIICSLYASIGSRWSIIAAQLPGRTDNDIKNYWNTKLKKKLISTINNNNNNTSKKPHQNQNHHLYQYYPMFQNHYPSSLSSPSSLLSHAISPSSSSSYQCTSTYYNDSPSNSMTMSFTQGCYNNISSTSNNNNNNTLILKQDYPHQMLKDNSTLLVFGGDHHHQNHQHQPSSCSSDGSCSITQMITNQVKQEDHHDNNIQHQQNYGGQVSVNHHQGKRLSDVNHGDHNTDQMLVDQKPSCVTTTAGLWGQNSQNTSLLLDYGLEEIKQLISTNINVDNSFNYFGENKATEEKDTKVMYYYY